MYIHKDTQASFLLSLIQFSYLALIWLISSHRNSDAPALGKAIYNVSYCFSRIFNPNAQVIGSTI